MRGGGEEEDRRGGEEGQTYPGRSIYKRTIDDYSFCSYY